MFHNRDGMANARRGMANALAKKGIFSGRVLETMTGVPRHLFVSEALRYRAYEDEALPIGFGQTISKPSVIALMVQSLFLSGDENVLEVGTGSGYQSAVLSRMAKNVVTMERIRELSLRASGLLIRLNYANITFCHTDDFGAVPGTFDAIVVSAGAESLPPVLFGKLKNGGRLVIPVFEGSVHVIKKFVRVKEGVITEENIGEAFFVPLILGASA